MDRRSDLKNQQLYRIVKYLRFDQAKIENEREIFEDLVSEFFLTLRKYEESYQASSSDIVIFKIEKVWKEPFHEHYEYQLIAEVSLKFKNKELEKAWLNMLYETQVKPYVTDGYRREMHED